MRTSEKWKGDILHVNKDAVGASHFHYQRDERLAMKGVSGGQEKAKRLRVRKLNTALLIVMGAAILVLIFVIVSKYFL